MRRSLEKYFQLISSNPLLFDNEGAPLRIEKDLNQILLWESLERDVLKDSAEAEIGVVFEDSYLLGIRDLVEFPDGRKSGYTRIVNQADLKGGRGVVVLPKKEHELLLLRQYRHATRSWHYEIPRGFGEPGVSSLEQANNEIVEEIAGLVKTLIPLGRLNSNTGLEGGYVDVFLAEMERVGNPNEGEGIEAIEWFSLAEFEAMIREGKLTDAFTIGAYAMAKVGEFL